MGEKYLLCANLVIDDEKITRPIAKASLRSLLKYTSYCGDFGVLCKTLESSNAKNEAAILRKYCFSKAQLVIKKSGDKTFEMPVLYKNDLDVLLFNESDLRKILNTYDISDTFNTNNALESSKEKIKEKITSYIFDTFFAGTQFNGNDITDNMIKQISRNPEYMISLAKYLKHDVGVILFTDTYDIKHEKSELQKRLDELDKITVKKKEENISIVKQIEHNLSDLISLLPKEKEEPRIKSNSEAESMDEYLLDSYIEQNAKDSSPILVRQIDLLREKIKIKKRIEQIKKDINQNFVKRGVASLTDLENRLTEIEKELDLLDAGYYRFSDAGFLDINTELSDQSPKM